MLGWLRRLFGGAAAPAPRVAKVPAKTAGAPADLSEAPAGFGLRRPLVGRNGRVAGFELSMPPSAQRRLEDRGDSPAAVAHHVALLAAANALGAAGRSALVTLPAALLAKPTVLAAAGAGVMLLVDDLSAVPPEATAALRARGAMLGLPDGPPSASPAVDFVVMQANAGGIDTLLLSAQRWREKLPRVLIVGLGLAHLDDIEQALGAGLSLAGGQLGRSKAGAVRRELGAAAHRICELLNHLALDRDTGVIAEAVRGDVALTYRLLRYANSPAIGLRRSVESVDEAVLLLGRAELYRWLSVQLMSASASRQAARALQESALARGRILEAVARARGEPNPGAHFTLGVLSLIEQLMQVPMASAVAPLRLGQEYRDALLARSGPWGGRLDLLDALDASDSARSDALAQGLGLATGLAQVVEDAWAWAAEVAKASAGA